MASLEAKWSALRARSAAVFAATPDAAFGVRPTRCGLEAPTLPAGAAALSVMIGVMRAIPDTVEALA